MQLNIKKPRLLIFTRSEKEIVHLQFANNLWAICIWDETLQLQKIRRTMKQWIYFFLKKTTHTGNSRWLRERKTVIKISLWLALIQKSSIYKAMLKSFCYYSIYNSTIQFRRLPSLYKAASPTATEIWNLKCTTALQAT